MAFRRAAPNYTDAYRSYGLNPKREMGGASHRPNVAIRYAHHTKTTHDRVAYKVISTNPTSLSRRGIVVHYQINAPQPTHANFGTIFNRQDGVIIGWCKYGPRYNSAMQRRPVTILPKLQHWSDIAFHFWIAAGGGAADASVNLRYIWSAEISNKEFPGIIGHALCNVGRRPAEKSWERFGEKKECDKFGWDNRVQFGMDTSEGQALLGSPNGLGAGYLLLEHKATFGQKATIEKVVFYCGKNEFDDPEMNLIFHVVTGEEDEEESASATTMDGPHGSAGMMAPSEHGPVGDREEVLKEGLHHARFL